MERKKILKQINVLKQCREYNLPLWQCPSFLFLLIGIVIILTMISTHLMAARYIGPEMTALLVMGMATVLLIVGHVITRSFDLLARTNRMKSEFIGIASHELRTPLISIKWLVDLIASRQSDLPPEFKDIKTNTKRMIRLVNGLLNVSRIEQGKFSFVLVNVSIGRIIQKIVNEYSVFAKANHVQLVVEAEKNLPHVKADEKGMELIIKNLIDNAIKYNRRKGKIIIRLFRKGKKIHCEVQDYGVGISAEDKKSIFEKFFRGEGTLKRQITGTGLGLYVAREFTRQFKGEMGFQSQEGEGSTFWFEFPIKLNKT